MGMVDINGEALPPVAPGVYDLGTDYVYARTPRWVGLTLLALTLAALWWSTRERR